MYVMVLKSRLQPKVESNAAVASSSDKISIENIV